MNKPLNLTEIRAALSASSAALDAAIADPDGPVWDAVVSTGADLETARRNLLRSILDRVPNTRTTP